MDTNFSLTFVTHGTWLVAKLYKPGKSVTTKGNAALE